ncbi:MAG: serine/threonine protein kinase [Proteobacteria bacterium]|nr:serine/threonine protein kinase [Pseudomonadota bacterium]
MSSFFIPGDDMNVQSASSEKLPNADLKETVSAAAEHSDEAKKGSYGAAERDDLSSEADAFSAAARGMKASTVKMTDEEAQQLKMPSRPSFEEPDKTIPLMDAVERNEELTYPLLDAVDNSGKGSVNLNKTEMLIFEQSIDRWSDAKQYELPGIGDKVGNYLIESELGRGGFGAVYRAKNMTLGRDEALKLILPSTRLECLDCEKRFEREIDIVSRLEHPNIVRLYSSGQIEHGVIWMTMELIEGTRLDTKLSQKGAIGFKRAKPIMLQLLCGLQEAHRRQIVHRDLKPANIMLSQKEGYEDQVVILDFGLSKALGTFENAEVQNVTVANSRRVYGTPQYMAPEQLTTGVPIGPWTDVYAAGLILFEILTGNAAVSGSSPFDIAYKQSRVPIALPPLLQDTAVGKIILKACSKKIDERYQNAGELYDALQHVEDISDPVSVLNRERNTKHDLTCPDKDYSDISAKETLITTAIPGTYNPYAQTQPTSPKPNAALLIINILAYILSAALIVFILLYIMGFISVSY